MIELTSSISANSATRASFCSSVSPFGLQGNAMFSATVEGIE